MWEIKISPSTKKGAFTPFVAKYNSKKEAEIARGALIRIAGHSVVAPCFDGEKGSEKLFVHQPWSVGEVTQTKDQC